MQPVSRTLRTTSALAAMTDRPPPSCVPLWEWMQTGLLVAVLGWTTYGLGGHRPETMAVTTLLIALLVAVHLVGWAIGAVGAGRPSHPAGWWLLPFLVYAAANVWWLTPARWLGWLDWLTWAHMIAVFWVVLNGLRSRRPRQVLIFALVAIALAAIGLACFQRFVDPNWLPLGRTQASQFHGRGSGPFGIPNSLAALLLLLFPATSALTLRRAAQATERIWWGWVTVILGFGLVLTISRGAWLGLTIALVMWPLLAARWTWLRRALVALLVLGGVAVVSMAVFQSSRQVRERTEVFLQDRGERTRPVLWGAAWELFRGQPITGTGAASYNLLFERHRPERFHVEPEWAHNEYLNTLSDYGLVGFVLFFGVAGLIAGQCGRRARPEARTDRNWVNAGITRVGLVIGLLAFALQLGVDFHFKIPALALTFATLCALVVGRDWEVAEAKSPRSALARWCQVGLAGAVLLGALVTNRWYRAEAARLQGREILDRLVREPADRVAYRQELAAARARLETAVRLGPGNGEAWSDLAYAIALFSRVESGRDADLGREAEAAAEHALAQTRVAFEFWIRRGVARNLQGRWAEAGNDFAEAVRLAPANALAWYHHAEHLSRNPTTIPLAHGSLTICLRLDPWNEPGLALRQRLAIGGKAP